MALFVMILVVSPIVVTKSLLEPLFHWLKPLPWVAKLLTSTKGGSKKIIIESMVRALNALVGTTKKVLSTQVKKMKQDVFMVLLVRQVICRP